MSDAFLKTIITVTIFFHGIGQLMGVIPSLKLFNIQSGPQWLRSWSNDSWLLNNILGPNTSGIICFVLFFLAFAGFIATGFGLVGWIVPQTFVQPLAIISAIISLLAITLFWNAFIMMIPHKIGSIGVNLTILISLLILHWSPKKIFFS